MRNHLLILVLGLLVAACGPAAPGPASPATAAAPATADSGVPRRSDAPTNAETRAAAIRAAAPTFRSVEGHTPWRGLPANYRGYFDGHDLRYVEETVPIGAWPALQNRYYFEGGALFYYAGENQAISGDPTGNDRSAVIMELDGSTVRRAVMVEGEHESPLDEIEVAAIRKRGAQLAASMRSP
jgi:hypothetical protein